MVNTVKCQSVVPANDGRSAAGLPHIDHTARGVAYRGGFQHGQLPRSSAVASMATWTTSLLLAGTGGGGPRRGRRVSGWRIAE